MPKLSKLTSAILVVLACSLARPEDIRAQAQSPAQQACAASTDKAFLKTVKALSKDLTGCLKAIAKGTASAATCFGSDPKGKVAAANQAMIASYAAGCVGSRPDFGFGGMPNQLTAAALTESNSLETLFGDDLIAALPVGNGDTAVVKCQQSVTKAVLKCADTQLKGFSKCKGSAFKEGASAPGTIADCFGVDAKIASRCDLDNATSLDAIRSAIGKTCTGAGADLVAAFPGCNTSDAEQLHACLTEPTLCMSCRQAALTSATESLIDCDLYDNQSADGSCLSIVPTNVTLPSPAEPDETPGSAGVVVTNSDLITQFGSASFSLNNSLYTRWRLAGPEQQPDAVMIAIAGFGGDANNFQIMAEDLLPKMYRDEGLVVELWGMHRRSDQLEDRAGALLGIDAADPLTTMDWYFGGDLALTLSPILVAGPNRRAHIYNTSSDIPFLANWTTGVFSEDIDVIVDAARALAKNQNVFLAGHSAGTGFTARYAASDFDATGFGPADPGYAKLRGVVLFEGGGGNTTGAPLTSDSLDRMEDKADGGLFAAVRDNAPRCVDGTPCTVATEAVDCAGKGRGRCTEPTTAYSAVGGITPAIAAASEPAAVQGLVDPDGGAVILLVDQGSAGNNAVAKVPGLSLLGFIGQQTVEGLFGQFLDDDGLGAGLSPAIATGLGAPGSGSPQRWRDITEGPLPASVLPNNGPAPTAPPAAVWGQEKELVMMSRVRRQFLAADTNAADWYYPASGLGVTSALGRCTAGTCTAGNIPAACTTNTDCAQSISLDSSALSTGRGRRDIVNLTQAGGIDIPVICFGGSNGLTPIGASYLGFASSIGTCTAPSCDGTLRVVNATSPSTAFPTYGGVSGGFEVHIREGLAHNDVLQSEDGPDSDILGPLAAFIARNVQ